MKLKMAERSLFAILLRSPWWISFVIAVVLGLLASAMLPRQYAALGPSAGFPFLVIGFIAAWKQLRAPSASRIAQARQALAAMSWNELSAAIEQAYRNKGCTITRYAGNGADFEIVGPQGKQLLGCKRWKAARTGVEPLQELAAAAEKEAAGMVFMSLGELTDNAGRYAAQQRIALMHDADLVMLASLAAGKPKVSQAPKDKER
jgi:restriction system protein